MNIDKIQESSTHLFKKKPFGSLLEISLTNHIFLKTFNSEFQMSKLLEMEDRINLTLVIK